MIFKLSAAVNRNTPSPSQAAAAAARRSGRRTIRRRRTAVSLSCRDPGRPGKDRLGLNPGRDSTMELTVTYPQAARPLQWTQGPSQLEPGTVVSSTGRRRSPA
jgi:hypothetical protein